MANNPQGSLPRRCGTWSATLGAYRLLSNDRVEPGALIGGHVQQTRAMCVHEPVVLCVQDSTELSAAYELPVTKLIQHSALAVRPDGRILGLLAAQWQDNPPPPEGESREARRLRPRSSQRWADTAAAVGPPPEIVGQKARWIHVADREADDFQFYHACLAQDCGFVVRSQHNRYVNGDTDRLWPFMQRQAPGGGVTVFVPRRKAIVDGPPRRWRQTQAARQARLHISWASVSLQPPRRDDRYDQPLSVTVVRAWETDPPANVEPPDWTLITPEPVTNLEQALFILECCRQRWRIEEWHRAQKTGCRLESSQLHDVDAFCRLAAISAVIAVRLLQLRDISEDEQADDPAKLRQVVTDSLVLQIVARLAKVADPLTLTPRQFLHPLARQGGWLARKHDGRPGWQTLWHGWQKVHAYADGIRLMNSS
jgi:hypothetical protein